MIDVLADAILHRVRPTTGVAPGPSGGDDPRQGPAAVSRGAPVAQARQRDDPAGPSPPPGSRPAPVHEALLTLLADLAWHRIRASDTMEDHDGMRQDSERKLAWARISPSFPGFDRGYAACSSAHTSPQRS